MRGDITKEVDTWYIIVEEEGYKIGDWEETLLEAERRKKDNPGKQIIVLSEKEWNTRYTKRGKKSLK